MAHAAVGKEAAATPDELAGGEVAVARGHVVKEHLSRVAVFAPPSPQRHRLPSATYCFAVGTLIGGDNSRTLVERWNGANWSLAPSPNSSAAYNSLSDVSCTSASNCMAVGGKQTFFRDNRSTLAQRWNGSTWAIVSSPNRPGYNELSSIACVSATNCTAGGKSSAGLGDNTLAETWNGTRWSLTSTPNGSGAYNSRLNGLACPASNICFAVGSSSTEVRESTLIERTT